MPFTRKCASLCVFGLLGQSSSDFAGDAPSASDIRCSSAGDDGTCSSGPTLHKDHVLLTLKTATTGKAATESAVACVTVGNDPFGGGNERQCCSGLEKQLRQSPGRWRYTCVAAAPPAPAPVAPLSGGCTPENNDPWRTGSRIECCSGLQQELGKWSGSDSSYRCRASAAPTPTLAHVTAAGGQVNTKVLEWNVHYSNKDTGAIARTIAEKHQPDIIGLCELTTSMDDMSNSLTAAMGKRFKVQPGRNGWKGYGTDIFYNDEKWKALEGGVSTPSCSSIGGQRAANWVVLQDRASGHILITGGIHLSYCRDGCNSLHECELGELYNHLEEMNQKYPNAPVVWMGDLNLNVGNSVVKNLLAGKIGGRGTFRVEDVAKTDRNTHTAGGSAIDHIFAEHMTVDLKQGEHGSTGQGVTGSWLSGADHFPIYSVLTFGR
eukprot:CAMPEP_0177174706 /NCGR_PEP_ID=MMETSP0367-20130122/12320_1 /TAXON_ID=447022 ORGANISM="Scrippsiella hangoei-like, Strain SHHI-4" /NCGR_SAMPLE_ID=MMETSP0367 /ASSEMBLY_ACC=CAM_ASM_000362 /LENGTH=433 /DNA_ID=CAMNT_0018621079 /DNA_START=53 /DNA_END=1354 /DNA_ORIENTATION=-